MDYVQPYVEEVDDELTEDNCSASGETSASVLQDPVHAKPQEASKVSDGKANSDKRTEAKPNSSKPRKVEFDLPEFEERSGPLNERAGNRLKSKRSGRDPSHFWEAQTLRRQTEAKASYIRSRTDKTSYATPVRRLHAIQLGSPEGYGPAKHFVSAALPVSSEPGMQSKSLSELHGHSNPFMPLEHRSVDREQQQRLRDRLNGRPASELSQKDRLRARISGLTI